MAQSTPKMKNTDLAPIMLAGIERLASEGKPISALMREAYERQTGKLLPAPTPSPLQLVVPRAPNSDSARRNTAQPLAASAEARRVHPTPTERVDKNLFTGISDAELDTLAAATDGREAAGGIAVIAGLRRALRAEFMAGKCGAPYGPAVVIQADIARFALTSSATVKRWLPKLVQAGIIEVESRKKPTGENYPCIYKMLYPVGENRRNERSPLAQYEPRGGLNMSGGVSSSTSKPVSYLRRDSEETVETTLLSAAPCALIRADPVLQTEPARQSSLPAHLFDALALATDGAPSQLTSNAIRSVGVALSQIMQVTPDLTPREINRRAENYRSHFKDAALTSTALAKHWARCDHNKNGTEPPGSQNWTRNPLSS